MLNSEIKFLNNQPNLLNNSEISALIDGIYNYCDRWCEQCSQTQCCSVYHLESESKNNTTKGEKDLNRIAEIFALTMDLLDELADEEEINIFEIEDLEFEEHKLGKIEMLANSYGTEIYQWMDKNSELFQKQILIFEDINIQSADNIRQAINAIDYYSLLIGAKIYRAFVKDVFIDELHEIPEFQNDQYGSAKVAIISIDNSIEALGVILGSFQECEEDILNLLAKLQKIRRKLYKEFPNVMCFIRPGFDTL